MEVNTKGKFMSARSFVLNKKKQGNITVEIKGNVIDVRLHGHLVAYKTAVDDIILSSCGYHTPTTITAINRFLDLLDRSERVVQIKGEWFLSQGENTVKFTDGMKIAKTKLEKSLS